MQRLVRGLRKQIGSELSVLAHFAWLVQKTDRPNTKHARWTQKRQWLILVTLREAPSEHLFARICWRVCRGASAKQSRVPGAGKIARLRAGWVVGRRGTARNCAENALPLHTKASQSKEACANSNLKTRLKKQPETAISQCCSLTEKDEKSELKCIWKEFKKAAPAPRNAITRFVSIASIDHENILEFNLFKVLCLALILKTHCRRRCQKCSATTHGSIPEQRSTRKTSIRKEAWKNNPKTPFPSAVLWKKRSKNQS